ncbi:VOC family protein [Pseudactinotalea sp. Z1732]|uniref:VOC family protein n=1 Tax=Micrococcales TaxID=85006 RepID=UPI003C7BE1E9
MSVTSVYPVLMSDDVAAAARFYREVLGFESTFEADWYVSLRLGEYELAILQCDHPTVPAGFGAPVRGLILNIEVEDVHPLHHALTAEHGLTPVLALRDEGFGQRHFIVEAPGGVLVDVIQPIPPTAQFAQAYAQEALPTG